MDNINLYQDDSSSKSPIPHENNDENVYIYDTPSNFFNLSDTQKIPNFKKSQPVSPS